MRNLLKITAGESLPKQNGQLLARATETGKWKHITATSAVKKQGGHARPMHNSHLRHRRNRNYSSHVTEILWGIGRITRMKLGLDETWECSKHSVGTRRM